MPRTASILLSFSSLINGITLLIVLLAAYVLFVPSVTHAQAKPCSVYSAAYNVPAGYGAAYNVHSLTREVLLQSMCDTAGFTATLGSSATSPTNFAVFTTGYRWDGSKWASFTMTPNGGSTSGSYVMGNAKSGATLAYTGEHTYWVSFACVLNGGKWKCGCRDAYCQSSYWNLQVAYNPPPPTIPGGGGAGGSGSAATDFPLTCEKKNYTVSGGKTVTVNSADALKAALAGAGAGDTIVLGAGNYGWMDLNNYQFSNYVAIKGTPGAKVQHIGMKNVKNIQLDSLNLEYGSAAGQTWQPKGIEIFDSENVRVVNSNILGNPSANTGEERPSTGVRFTGGKNFVLANNNISGWQRGVLSQSIDGFLFEHNVFTKNYSDGFMHQLTHNGAIQSNYFPDGFHHNGGPAHADYIQFDAGKGRHSSAPDSNIAIRGNVMLQGPDGSKCANGSDCGAVQGIFLGGAMGYIDGKEHLFSDFTITDNVYCASGKNGISSGVGAKNILIKNNVHYSCPPPFGDTHMSNIYFKGDPQINSKIESNIQGRVANTAEAIAKAKQFTWLNNCIIKGL